VADTGTGIAESDLPHIFEPFFTTKDEGYGVGLGLSTVYGIIQNHQGNVQVESQKGQGTTFTLCLPAV
jgi:signal transduction histidine kinase